MASRADGRWSAIRSCSKRTCLACSRRAMCGSARTVVSPRRWAKDRRRSIRCTVTCGRSDIVNSDEKRVVMERLARHRALGTAPVREHEWLVEHGSRLTYSAGDLVTAKGVQVPQMYVLF